jgi:transcriptional regulator GlxA family with amidase domain
VPTRRVLILTYEGIQPIDAVGPHEVFNVATQVLRSEGRSGGYNIALVSQESGLYLGSEPLPEPSQRIDTLVLPGGFGSRRVTSNQPLIAWIREQARSSRRVATVCSGTFLAAEAGLIDTKRVTTHWARAAELQETYPKVRVDSDQIYIRDGKVWSSAGVTAGIDLALALVEEDVGVSVAQTVARWLVMFLHRPGGQTQFASPVWVPRAERSTVRAVQTLIESTPNGDHRLPVLAAAAAMSVRHFARVFMKEVGDTPARFVERVRLEAARHELESTDDTLDLIASRSGFGTSETLRRVFQRRLGVSPDAYRRRFTTNAAERNSA